MVSKKQKEKRKDFQKTKLRVGKSSKPSNETDTSFKTKAIHLPSQLSSLSADVDLVKYLSLCKHHSSSTRKEALLGIQTYQTTHRTPVTSSLVKAISPLIVDISKSVREGLLELLKSLEPRSLSTHVSHIMLYIHSAMTHLDGDIRAHSTEFLGFMIDLAPDEVCRIAFAKTLSCFFPLLGWEVDTGSITNKFAATAATVSFTKKNVQLGHVEVLQKFLEVGLADEDNQKASLFHPDTHKFLLPQHSTKPFMSLGLFGITQDGTEQVDQRISLVQSYSTTLLPGLDETRKQGGPVGRVAGTVFQLVQTAIVP